MFVCVCTDEWTYCVVNRSEDAVICLSQSSSSVHVSHPALYVFHTFVIHLCICSGRILVCASSTGLKINYLDNHYVLLASWISLNFLYASVLPLSLPIFLVSLPNPGSPPSKVYGQMRSVARRAVEKFWQAHDQHSYHACSCGVTIME